MKMAAGWLVNGVLVFSTMHQTRPDQAAVARCIDPQETKIKAK